MLASEEADLRRRKRELDDEVEAFNKKKDRSMRVSRL
jgi:hypothetical protein